MENYIGRLLDNRYEILEIIGMGGMAVVYKARDHRLKRLVAVKILKDEYSQDEDFRRRFTAESQAVAMLSHPNIVAVYDVNSSEGVNYIVMELIDGITLKQYMDRRGQLNWRETLHFSMQITKALDHAHSRGIIHRDIKPHNIMILKDGSVKVADFGIARMTSAQSTLTREALGSVHYISPEQAKGGKVDCRTDIYSLGVVMYEMMTARPPFDGDTPVSVAIQHISGTAEQPRSLNPEIPEGMEQITMHAMTADLASRYASAADLLADLEEFRKNPAILFEFSQRSRAGQTASETADSAAPVHSEPRAHDLSELYGDDPKPEKKKKQGGNRTGLILLLIVAISVVAVALAWVLISYLNRDNELKVPDFVDVYYGDIIPSNYPDFSFEAKEWVYSNDKEFGYIIEQSPEADTLAKPGTVISLTISYGKRSNKMPALVGDLAENATTMLDAMKLDLKIHFEYENSGIYDKGEVIRTDPADGVALSEGQDVTIYVSMGEDELPEQPEKTDETVAVPRLVGMNLNDATALLQGMNLNVGKIKNVESDKEKDTVVSQSIPQDTEVAVGTRVDLQISLGRTEGEGTETPPEEPEEEQENPLDPNEEAPPPSMEKKTKVILIRLPDPTEDGRKTVRIAILLNGEVSADFEDVPLADGAFPATLTGKGIMTMDVYIDGMFSYTEDVDFNE